MAEQEVIGQLKERVEFLGKLVMSLVANNDPTHPSPNPVTTQASINTANGVQAVSATTDESLEEEVPYLMRLAPEIRMDILERVIQPTFAAEPYGLVPPPLLPVTTYTAVQKFAAVLQVNQTIRAESMTLYLELARAKRMNERGSKSF